MLSAEARLRASSAASVAASRPAGRVTLGDPNLVASITSLGECVIVGSMRDDPQQARGMGSRSVRTAEESADTSRRLEVCSSGLSQRVDKPVGSPVKDRESGTIPLNGRADGGVRLVRRNPYQFARIDNATKVPIGGMRDGAPDSGEGPGVVRGFSGASGRRGDQRLTVSTNVWQEGATGDDKLEGPGFGGRSSVAPGGGPAQAIGDQVALVTGDNNAKSSTPYGSPLAVKQ